MPDSKRASVETIPDGVRRPDPNAPPIAYQPALSPDASMLTDEVDPPLPIVDKGFGPYGLEEDLTDEQIEAAQADDESRTPEEEAEFAKEQETKPEDDSRPPPQDTSEEGDDEKENPETVPYDRFQQIAAENQRLKQADQILQWMLANPEQAAARLGAKAQAPTAPEPKFQIGIEEPKATKPIEELDDTEKARLWVERSTYNYLKGNLEKIGGALSDLFTFKDQLTETLTRNAIDKEGKPLHPRWDELRGTMHEVKARYPGMSDTEAYVLADRMIPQSTPMGDEMAAYNRPVTPAPQAKSAPVLVPKPKRASPAALRASKIASLGRSSPGTTSVTPERLSPESAAERAFDEIMKMVP